jgi:hypothetical protein
MLLESIFNKLRWSLRKNAPEARALLISAYPDFILSSRPSSLRDQIPVFYLHSVEPISFEKQLQFLRQNRYQTLDADEFRAAIAGETPVPDRSILLTFDDGTASLWTVAFPLLGKYGFRAVSFIIPGCISDKAPDSPTLLEYEKGRVSLTALLAREKGLNPFCSWEEITEMHATGLIDFQSHTMYHHSTFVSPRLVDFLHPNYDRGLSNFNIPVCRFRRNLDFTRNPPLGTPLYRFEPRTVGRPEYFDPETVRAACVDFVLTQGGTEFFTHKNWRQQLYRVYCEVSRNCNNRQYESMAEMTKAIFEDFLQSKRLIEKHLPGKTVDHLCYPWFMGSKISVAQSQRVGYRVNYWGTLSSSNTNQQGSDLFSVARIDSEYIYRLPGNGRKSLRKILSTKVKKNIPGFFSRLRN